ncbi:MAG: M13 family metallopeptidase [Candidatus Pacebacteria bacterium]|nr:M13 family metallopeptidase [Candidatus Paceibacterota bacterium]
MKAKNWGFDVREIEPTIRPQDDFFHHVNKRWMEKNPIPANESRWGSFLILRYDSEKKLQAILHELDATRNLPSGSPEKIIRDFYRSGMDMKRRNELGLLPLKELRTKIEKIGSVKDLLTEVAALHRIGVGVLWGAGIDQDAKNSERYLLHFYQDGIGMPDRDYYLKEDEESVRVRTAYRTHVEGLFRIMGSVSKEAKERTETILRVETMLAKAMMKKEDSRDTEKTYHKKTLKTLARETKNIDWERYLKLSSAKEIQEVIVMQPDFLKAVNDLLPTVSLEDWKVYLDFHVVNDFSGVLSDKLVKHSFTFYGTVLSGTKVMKPLWRRVLGVVNGHVGELLGRIYVKKHFTAEAKKRMNLLVDDLFTAYEARLKSLDWMTPATKKKALVKLHALNRKIGYPDKWKNFNGLEISPTDYVGNIIRTNEFEHLRAMKKLRGPIDRSEWFMYPQTVNAYFSPSLNDIAFPAAILQPPFFSLTADDAVNYGCIGAVIGHEITHGFDDQGSKMDHKGNLKSWWTTEDRKRFEAKARKVERQFDTYTVADGVHVNGKLTLGENIADLGGLSIAYDAYQLALARTGRTDIDGLTPEQRFFISFAVFERENVRPEFEKTHALTDPHSPGVYRINGPVSNYDEFYKAFNITKSDVLYRAPHDREMVW